VLTRAKVLALDERDPQTAGNGVERDACARRATAYNQQVVFMLCRPAEVVEHLLARRRRPWRGRAPCLERRGRVDGAGVEVVVPAADDRRARARRVCRGLAREDRARCLTQHRCKWRRANVRTPSSAERVFQLSG
jgi:hypothetical protein